MNRGAHLSQHICAYSCSAGDSDIGGNEVFGLGAPLELPASVVEEVVVVAASSGADVFRLEAPDRHSGL